jgi:hypothetical protein
MTAILGHFFPKSIDCALILTTTGLGYILGDFFSQTHRVTLSLIAENNSLGFEKTVTML